MKITGWEAIDYANRNHVALNKHTDPTEGAREGLTVQEAREVAAEDPSLIWVEVERMAWTARCSCYRGHESASGRCQARDVHDPTRAPGEAAICNSCRDHCGNGEVEESRDARMARLIDQRDRAKSSSPGWLGGSAGL